MKKILAVLFLAVFLCLPCFTGCGLTESGTADKETMVSESAEADEGIDLTGRRVISMSNRMTFSETTRESGEEPIILEAEVYPSMATDKRLDWSCRWEDASDSWTNGKTVTEYLRVTATSEGAATAEVECLKGFSSPIVIEVRSRQNPDAYAECHVDYKKRLMYTRVSFTYADDSNHTAYDDFVLDNNYYVEELPLYGSDGIEYWSGVMNGCTVSFYDVWTGGTIDVKNTDGWDLYLQLSPEFASALEAAGAPVTDAADDWYEVGPYYYSILDGICGEDYITGYQDYGPNQSSWEKFLTGLVNNTANYDFKLKVVSNCSDGEGHETEYRCRFDRTGGAFAVESVTLPSGNVVI